MKKIVLFSLLLSSFNLSAKTCDVGQFAELEPVADAPFESHKKCLRSLADSPTTPEWPQSYFKTINGEEIIITGCNLKDNNDFTSYAILSSKGIRAIRFPVYHFITTTSTGTINDSLPGNITHFVAEGKNFFVSPSYGEARILTKETLPALATEMQMTMSKVNSKIKKYEDYLKSVGRFEEINVTSDPIAVEKVMPCLEGLQQETVKTYVFGKFHPSMPAYSTIIGDYNKFQELDPEARKKYERPFDEWKKVIIADLVATHPVCQGVIEDSVVEKAFEDSWGKNKQYYELIRLRFVPEVKP
jgi:hypothetical protein